MKKNLLLFIMLLLSACLHAAIKMPKVFGDNMVLQRNKPIQVWGWANTNEKVIVRFNRQLKTTKGDGNGKWSVRLENEHAGGPYQLVIQGENQVIFNNILVGEVWVCSGQSNMAFQVQLVTNAAKEIENADYPEIRHFFVPNTMSLTPREDLQNGEWTICKPSTAANFTAVGYFFAKKLYDSLKVPIGLINASWGATVVETWTSREAFEDHAEYQRIINSIPDLDPDSVARLKSPNSYPSLLFNAMVKPLIPYTIQGVIWYQGESNAANAYQYRKAFPLMINDWRKHWKQGKFPFYFVQLSSFNAANGNSEQGSTWAELREAQALALAVPNTGMAVTTDIGHPTAIHPENKQDVGKRLAAIALHKLYGGSDVYGGPVYQTMKIVGKKVNVGFTGTGSGLMVKDKLDYIKGFEVAGADQHFHEAKALLDGNTVIVVSDRVDDPVAVRYGWADDAGEDNLFNQEGFPAAPFRTDSWKSITEGATYEIAR